MFKEYRTVKDKGTAEYEEKKSKFMSNVAPVKSEEEAVNFINTLRSEYWDANHNVYAYRIIGDSIIQRYSDDGEPAGTAGLPVLEAIKRADLQNVVIVVTRYFGGTLLGAPGLVRAYGKSASMGIDSAGIIKKVLCTIFTVAMDYTFYGKAQNVLTDNGYNIENAQFTEQVSFTVAVVPEKEEAFIKLVNDITAGSATIKKGGQMYIDTKVDL